MFYSCLCFHLLKVRLRNGGAQTVRVGLSPREADEMITEDLRWDEEQGAQRGGVSDPTSHS